jgi:hypothetical protein
MLEKIETGWPSRVAGWNRQLLIAAMAIASSSRPAVATTRTPPTSPRSLITKLRMTLSRLARDRTSADGLGEFPDKREGRW